MLTTDTLIKSSHATYEDDFISADYVYKSTFVKHDSSEVAQPEKSIYTSEHKMNIRTERKLPKLGVMIAGFGGNNGSTLMGMVIANRHSFKWRTRKGTQQANFFGSQCRAATTFVGYDETTYQPVYAPFFKLLPMVHPSLITFDGWDISGANLHQAIVRAQVFDPELQDMLQKFTEPMRPRPAAFDANFVAKNQKDRADNLIPGVKSEQVRTLRSDIRQFKQMHELDKVIVLWMGNTERFSEVRQGLNCTARELLVSLQENQSELSPSTMYGIAAVLEGCPFINGSPQNTFVPGLVELAKLNKVPIVGDDLKTGQTKLKTVLVDFLVSAGIKPRSIVSYNHLGNNDGLNLSEEVQFKPKEVSKSSVLEDAIASNDILFPDKRQKPDHLIVIKYIPEVGDSKRAMDEYVSELAMGGRNTLVIHNTCEDSLLASALILDLIVFTELFSRMSFRLSDGQYEAMDELFTVLSYFTKAPLRNRNTCTFNSLSAQRSCIENIFRAALGLDPIHNMHLEYKLKHFLRTIQDACLVMDADSEKAVNGHCQQQQPEHLE